MNKLCWGGPLLGTVLLIATSQPGHAQSKERIYRELDSDQIAGVLKDLGVKYKMTQPAKTDKVYDFEFERNSYNIRMKLSQGKLVGLAAFFPKAKIEKINEWNQKAKFSRAVLNTVDGRDYAVIDSHLNAGGGVTVNMLRQFVRRFDDEVARFDNFLRN
jgi:hypothetical protein